MTRSPPSKMGLLCLGVLAFCGAAYAADASYVHEVLVLASAPTMLPRLPYASGGEICNNGPNQIDCSAGAYNVDGGCTVFVDGGLVALTNKAKRIGPSACWPHPYSGTVAICCIAATADQVTGAATDINEAP